MIRIGVVGTGGMAAQRAAAFAALDGVSVVAVYGRRPERAEAVAATCGATAATTLAGLLDASDAVVVAVPNAEHAPCARAALEAGRHVLVEYPLSTELAAAESLAALAEAQARVLMVGNTIVHEAMFRHVSERVDRLGELVSAASRASFHGVPAGYWYYDDALRGSLFAAFHYHHIEYYRRLLGEVTWLSARDESRPGWAGGTLVLGHGTATSSIQWYLGAESQGELRGFWLTGTRGSVTVVTTAPGESLAIWNTADGGLEPFADEWGVADSTAEFIAAVRGELDPRPRLRSDLRTLAVGLAATDAAASGQPLTLTTRTPVPTG